LRKAAARVRGKSKPGKESALAGRRSAADIPLGADDELRFAALRAWRADLAREQGVPAYVILHDRSLRELAARRPAVVAELLDVPGIGQAKADRYGEALIRLLA
jgi:ATP-dependent DNA helicase RecQ